jgi:hypothetical protein
LKIRRRDEKLDFSYEEHISLESRLIDWSERMWEQDALRAFEKR